jgi:broad specificity phosphatase PhoE
MTCDRRDTLVREPATVYLLRHGESTYNARHRALVRIAARDARLTDRGQRQAAAARPAVRALDVDLVLVSPLTRALQTAEIVAGGVPVIVEPLLREWQGNWCDVGRPASVLREAFPALSFGSLPEVWWSEPAAGSPAGADGLVLESRERFEERVSELDALLRGSPARRLLVVGHHALFLRLCGQELANCELSLMTAGPDA